VNKDKAVILSIAELREFVLTLKRSYFSESGKLGANWKPLKPDTIRRKIRKEYSNPAAFNYASGTLRDSCKIDIKYTGSQLIITCTFDGLEDKIIKCLTQYYGRDFLTFTQDEQEIITQEAAKIIQRNLGRS
jgi:hypothetical protein